MTRWPALVLTAVVASLAGAASAPEAPARRNELLPSMPWPVPAAEPQLLLIAPAPVIELVPPKPSEPPAPEAVATRWYQDPPRVPEQLYLERELTGGSLEDRSWEALVDAPSGADRLDRSLDEPLSFGLDGRMEHTTAEDENGHSLEAFMLGPSMKWRPSNRTHIDLSPMVGINSPYPMSEVVLVFGWKY